MPTLCFSSCGSYCTVAFGRDVQFITRNDAVSVYVTSHRRSDLIPTY